MPEPSTWLGPGTAPTAGHIIHVRPRPQWCSRVERGPCSSCSSHCWHQSSTHVHHGCIRGQQQQRGAHNSAVSLACSSSRTYSHRRTHSQHRSCGQHRWAAYVQHIHGRYGCSKRQQGHWVSRGPLCAAPILLQSVDTTGGSQQQHWCHLLVGRLLAGGEVTAGGEVGACTAGGEVGACRHKVELPAHLSTYRHVDLVVMSSWPSNESTPAQPFPCS